MPHKQLRFKPGIDVETTPALSEGGYSISGYIRFKAGLPEKIGGWVRFYPSTIGASPRALHAWNDLNNVGHLAVGSSNALNVITTGAIATITPQTLTTNPPLSLSTTAGSAVVSITDGGTSGLTVLDSVVFNTPISVGGLILSGLYPITLITGASQYQITAGFRAAATVTNGGTVPSLSTVINSPTVTIAFANHGLSIGGKIVFPITVAVGGLSALGTYSVASVIDANTFTINVASVATSTTSAPMNGGAAQFAYILNIGPAPIGVGYGLGAYGAGSYGLGAVASAQTGPAIPANDWTLDNWGELLIAIPENGPVYYWGPNRGLTTSSLVSTGPLYNSGGFIAMPAQILVTWGSTLAPGVLSNPNGQIGAIQDPMIVQWSDQLDFTVWTPTLTNQAGNFRIPRGSRIVSGLQGPNQAYIWTDIGVWSMQYQGASGFVFGFNELGQGCGLIAKHARCVLRGAVFYMSQNNFYVIGNSAPTIIPCTVWDTVFQDLDVANSYKCSAVANSLFSEIEFNFPSLSGGTGECDKCAVYNVVEGVWCTQPIGRSAGIDQSVLGTPIKTTAAGLVYQHEIGFDADGAPLTPFIETGLSKIADGNQIAFVDLIYPDMIWSYGPTGSGATVNITLTEYDTPNSPGVSLGPYVMTSKTQFVPTRLRGRYMKIRLDSNDSGTFWRMGGPTYRYATDGRS